MMNRRKLIQSTGTSLALAGQSTMGFARAAEAAWLGAQGDHPWNCPRRPCRFQDLNMKIISRFKTFLGTACVLLATLCFCPYSNAALWLPHSLSDHILFQQGERLALWGKAAPHSEIIAEISNEESGAIIDTASAFTDADGHWELALKPLHASFKKYTIKITGDGDTRLIHDALVGELWLSCGQSNMELRLRFILGGRNLMASAAHDGLRIFYQDNANVAWRQGVSKTPVDDTVNGRWLSAISATNVANCSGVAYTFALALYDALNKNGKEVPVGVMNSAVGATAVESWMSRAAMESDPQLKAKLPANWNVGNWARYNQPMNQPTALFNLKIAPLTRHSVRGFIWYQGEGNAGSGMAGEKYYQTAMAALIHDWRQQWGGQPRPFVLSQLAAFDANGKMPPEDLESWAYLREAQFEVAQAVPQTAAIPIHDVPLTWNTGDFDYKSPVHPLDKKPVGERMALAARSLVYGEAVEYLGPVYERMEIKGEKVVLHFQHAQGLKPGGGGRLLGFALCGADRHFVEAEARIVGEVVELSNLQVKTPVAVTYAFTSMNHAANLFNGHDLPAYPFRTDQVKSDFLKGSTAMEAEAALTRAASSK